MTADPIQQNRELHESLPPAPFVVKKIQLNEIEGDAWIHDSGGEMCDIPMEDICALRNLLPILITEAERWRAMAIEERTHRVAYENNVPLSEYRDRATCYAARELRAESSSWRKIGLVEKEAIETAIGLMKDCNHFPGEIDYSTADFNEEIAVLKKLLEGT